jgi:hypothetical protein
MPTQATPARLRQLPASGRSSEQKERKEQEGAGKERKEQGKSGRSRERAEGAGKERKEQAVASLALVHAQAHQALPAKQTMAWPGSAGCAMAWSSYPAGGGHLADHALDEAHGDDGGGHVPPQENLTPQDRLTAC